VGSPPAGVTRRLVTVEPGLSSPPPKPPSHLPEGLRFLTVATIPELFHFPADMTPVEAEVNRLNDQILVRYYERDWKDIAR